MTINVKSCNLASSGRPPRVIIQTFMTFSCNDRGNAGVVEIYIEYSGFGPWYSNHKLIDCTTWNRPLHDYMDWENIGFQVHVYTVFMPVAD